MSNRTAKEGATASIPPSPADLNLRILLPLARFLIEQHGRKELARIAEIAVVNPEALDGTSHWVSLNQFETLLKEVRSLVSFDEEFKNACAYDFAKHQGPARFLVGAMSPSSAYAIGGRTTQLISTIGEFEAKSLGPGLMRMTYTSRKPESTRLMCLSRQAQMQAIPTMWKLPPAHVEERSCTMRGDACCDYLLRFYEPRRWVPALLGLVVGTGASVLMPLVFQGDLLSAVGAPFIGLLLGHVYELMRTNRANLHSGTKMNDSYLAMAQTEAAARRELGGLEQRQRQWSQIMEERVEERTATLSDVVDRIQKLQQSRVITLRGVSHDLRNPLAVMATTASYLRDGLPHLDAGHSDALDDLQAAVSRMDGLLVELMEAATSRAGLVQLDPQELEVASLADKIRRRLRAMVHRRDVRTSVFASREAPKAIDLDPLVFDRVIDDLLTNAAKYTEQGSIIVEIAGTPGFLTIKISDTGRGIPAGGIESVFVPRNAALTPPTRDSYGIGLSVVVRLLDQIGGKLEVMSKEGMGTTFWARFPTEAPPASTRAPEPREAADSAVELVNRVVTIRRVESA